MICNSLKLRAMHRGTGGLVIPRNGVANRHPDLYSLDWVAKLAEAAKKEMDPKFTRLEEFDYLFKNHVMFMIANISYHQSGMVVPQAE